MIKPLLERFAKSREGRHLLDHARQQGIDIVLDRQLPSGAACFIPAHGVITLSAQDETALLVSVLAHELRHTRQYAHGLIPGPLNPASRELSPEAYIILSRMTEADASAFQTLFARQHVLETGDSEVIRAANYWSFFRAARDGDLPARQMLDAAENFLSSPHYWKQYRPRYLEELEILAGSGTPRETIPATIQIDSIRRFGRLETTLPGVAHYLDGADDGNLQKRGFFDLPRDQAGRPDTEVSRACRRFRQCSNPRP